MTPKIPKNYDTSMVRSSAAEYLTFVAASGKGGSKLFTRMRTYGLRRK